MDVLRWLLTAAPSFALGVLFVQYLTAHPLKRSRFTSGIALVLCALAASIALLSRRLAFVPAISMSFAMAAAGYATDEPVHGKSAQAVNERCRSPKTLDRGTIA